jgi:hypothetical protein
MTAKTGVANVTTGIFELLEPLSPEDRQRAIAAAQTLLGTPTTLATAPVGMGGAAAAAGSAQAFFGQKQPSSTPEALAVAARYRELTQAAMEHTKDDFRAVFRDARRSFDSPNFGRDVGNARTVGLFVRGKDISLADYGQQYVDKLPDRTAIKDLKRPKRAKRTKKKRG